MLDNIKFVKAAARRVLPDMGRPHLICGLKSDSGTPISLRVKILLGLLLVVVRIDSTVLRLVKA